MKNIVVIGAGTMGNGIAHVFAMTGHSVKLVDVSADALNRAMTTISKNLDRLVSKGSLTEDEKAVTLANITTNTDLSAVAVNAELIVEAAFC